LRFFALATRDYAMIINTTIINSNNRLIKVWATLTTTHIHCVVLHKNLNSTEPATINLDLSTSLTAPFPTGRLIRYISKLGPYATYEGITLAGQTYVGSMDGTPIGDWTVEDVPVATRPGLYSFEIPPISMVLISFARATAEATAE